MPTAAQQKILVFIRNFLETHQMPPTLREIQEHCGYSAIGSVQDHMKRLVKEGLIEIKPGLARGLTLTQRFLGIPIVGSVPAGPAQLAFEDLQGYLSTSNLSPLEQVPLEKSAPISSSTPLPTVNAGGLFALRVKGDSMIEAGILPNDLVIVKPQNSGKNGDIVVARIGEEEATVKRLVRKPGLIQLAPANPRYQPLTVDDSVEIIGKVIRVVRHYS